MRVGEKKRDDGATVVVGCRFDEPLRAAACKRLGIALPDDAALDEEDRPQTRVRDLLALARAAGATDLHLKGGSPPRVRVGGALTSLESEALDEFEAEAMALDLMESRHSARFGDTGYAQFVFALPEVGRFRVHVLRQAGRATLAVRCLPAHVPSLADLGVPDAVRAFAALESGLVFVSGRARSGRTTLLASLVDEVNRTRSSHVVTLDQTIEFVHVELAAHITQRDLAEEATPCGAAIRQALALDADVIAAGALRDADALDAALDAAESGRLVLAAVTGSDAGEALTGVLHLAPEREHATFKARLSRTLRGVIAVGLEHDDAGAPHIECSVHRHKGSGVT